MNQHEFGRLANQSHLLTDKQRYNHILHLLADLDIEPDPMYPGGLADALANLVEALHFTHWIATTAPTVLDADTLSKVEEEWGDGPIGQLPMHLIRKYNLPYELPNYTKPFTDEDAWADLPPGETWNEVNH